MKKTESKLYYIAGVLFYFSAVMSWLNTHHMNSMFVVWLALGSAFLCIGASSKNK